MPRSSSSFPWQRWSALLTVVPLAILFDRLFWDMELGLNLTLFALAAMAVAVGRYGWTGISKPARIAFIGTAIAALMVYVHHSQIALLATIAGLILFLGVVHEPALRSVFFAVPQAICAFVMAPSKLRSGIATVRGEGERENSGRSWVRLGILPALVTLLFVLLYRGGNPRFEAMTAGIFDGLFDLFGELFTTRMLFFAFGLVICTALVRRVAPGLTAPFEARFSDLLLRVRVKRQTWVVPPRNMALERERHGAIILLAMVNAVLLIVNLIDISWVWIGFTVPEDFSLKQFVHEGTWLLIVSIQLSIGVLLHLFRGNLNFHPRNTLLKKLAMVWVAQNFILGISVFLRNWHYINFHGLAHRRIGVIVFLVLVLVGLITLFLKIRDRRSFFYLVRVNGWAWFVMLIGLSLVDWDSSIVRYNLRHDNPGQIDIDNYLHMSDKVLPLLYANLDKVQAQMQRHSSNHVRWVEHLDPVQFRRDLDEKRNRFIQRVGAQHWQESNWADQRTMAALDRQ